MDSDLHQVCAKAAAKAQRRSDLVTLTAAALTSLALKHGSGSGWQENVAWEAVSVAEAALAEIERRMK